MKVRGPRRCTECGERWSYYETGSPACPACGGLQSVAVDDERRLHTDAPASLDLAEARSTLGERPIEEVAGAAASAAREYVNARGFVDGGELQPLDDEVLAAAELKHVAGRLERALSVEEAEERHFLDLLAGAEAGARPADVPPSLRDARGLASAETVAVYRRDLTAWLDDREDPGPGDADRPTVRRLLGRLRDHERRVFALEGDVAPAEADALVAAARDVGEYLRVGDPAALEGARGRLDLLE